MSDNRQPAMTVVDGRNALAYLIILPNADGSGVLIDAAANGISKQQAAYMLRRVADKWDAEAAAEGGN